jgi:hypothetical protein
MYEAKVIADSVCHGHRLTTMQLTHPRIVHAEFMTHCMFARNASSSRAIPFNVLVQRVFDDPYIPRTFSQNQRGMQPAAPLEGWKLKRARELWLAMRNSVAELAREMAAINCTMCGGSGKREGWGLSFGACPQCFGTGEGLNVHKETVNRPLEPWGWITCAVTGMWDAWSNYFSLRCHPMAAEALRDQAYPAQLAYFRSKPDEIAPGGWHTPYLTPEEKQNLLRAVIWEKGVAVSVGRVARTSYLTQEGKHDVAEDVALHDRLALNRPMHASPLEQVCQAMGDDVRYGKYTGWKSYRHMLPGEYVTDFKPNHPELV